MARILRTYPLQRNVLIVVALFIAFNVFIVSEYTFPRKLALSLDDVYDPPPPASTLDVPEPGSGSPAITNSTKPRILLVSALFVLPKSKHPKDDYLAWLPRFLGQITTDVYFYTTPDLAPAVRAARGSGLPLTLDTSFSSPFDIPALKGREVVYRQMHAADRERRIHSPELYAVWNAKPFFVEHAMKALRLRDGAEKKEYDYVFWNDGGSFREDHVYTEWPDPKRVERVWEEGSQLTGSRKEDLMFFPMFNAPPRSAKDWSEDMGPVDTEFSEGSFFGGSPETMLWFSRTFYAYHDHYVSLGFFSGKDQTIYNALMLLFPSRFITVWVSDPSAPARGGLPPNFMGRGHLGACGPEWYYYQWWLSGRNTREAMREWWMTHDRDPQAAGWWKMRIPCRFTRVLGIEGVLKMRFGKSWRAPVGSVTSPSRRW